MTSRRLTGERSYDALHLHEARTLDEHRLRLGGLHDLRRELLLTKFRLPLREIGLGVDHLPLRLSLRQWARQ